MSQSTRRKDKWTLSFNPTLKRSVITAATLRGVHPVRVLENLVREKFNPYGHTDVDDSVVYVEALRKRSRKQPDEAFLGEIIAWHKSQTS